jgi:hypothetical protein
MYKLTIVESDMNTQGDTFVRGSYSNMEELLYSLRGKCCTFTGAIAFDMFLYLLVLP